MSLGITAACCCLLLPAAPCCSLLLPDHSSSRAGLLIPRKYHKCEASKKDPPNLEGESRRLRLLWHLRMAKRDAGERRPATVRFPYHTSSRRPPRHLLLLPGKKWPLLLCVNSLLRFLNPIQIFTAVPWLGLRGAAVAVGGQVS